ncbi:FAD-binding oxidoreductase [Kribbella sp. NPDC058245]|uniref:FAD-binding oxidoreductase n=1 Tax=Kribbella sp. NPDC058245 TaxID=3346399 RepID=UPI0036ED2F87
MTELAGFSGTVLTPGQDGYDDARRLWNAQHDRRPAVIAQVRSAADVAIAVRYGVENGLEIAVRGGSHSISGASSVDDGLMIDLTSLNGVSVDAEARLARVGGGALLRDLDGATQEHGLAVPAGVISHTGVGGLTLGGGMGWLTRKYGLSIDNLESVQLVSADGSILRAAEDENPDLFWGVRGGGGNFGVVTEFEFRLHEAGPMVHYGLQFWTVDQGAEVLRLARDLFATLPTDVNVVITALNAPPAPFVPEEMHFAPGYGLVIVGFGSPEEHAGVLEQIRTALPPIFEFATPMPYVALQQSLDEPNAWGHYSYEKGSYLEELTDGAIEVITQQVAQKVSPMSATLIYRLDKAYSGVDDDATAFGGERSDRFALFIVGHTAVPELLAAEQQWVRGFWEALQPHTVGIGSYVNGMTESDDDRIKASYGPKYERLQQIKAKYDPDNVFHRNQNIKPA